MTLDVDTLAVAAATIGVTRPTILVADDEGTSRELTRLALEQGGYDWGVLAYAVGFGGSMLWFGSSAGVAICSMYPEARSTVRWLGEGWPIVVGYVIGFAALILTLGWHPQ